MTQDNISPIERNGVPKYSVSYRYRIYRGVANLIEKNKAFLQNDDTNYISIITIGTYKKGDNVTFIYGGGRHYETEFIELTEFGTRHGTVIVEPTGTVTLEVFIDDRLTFTDTYDIDLIDDDTTYFFTIP